VVEGKSRLNFPAAGDSVAAPVCPGPAAGFPRLRAVFSGFGRRGFEFSADFGGEFFEFGDRDAGIAGAPQRFAPDGLVFDRAAVARIRHEVNAIDARRNTTEKVAAEQEAA